MHALNPELLPVLAFVRVCHTFTHEHSPFERLQVAAGKAAGHIVVESPVIATGGREKQTHEKETLLSGHTLCHTSRTTLYKNVIKHLQHLNAALITQNDLVYSPSSSELVFRQHKPKKV